MRRMKALGLFLALAASVFAQAVPASQAVTTQFEKVIVIRMKHQTDILAALEKHVKEEKIENAIILMGFGSAVSTNYHVVSNNTLPPTNEFHENENDGVDIVNINGAVLKGRVHAHITYANGKKAFGGHLEPRSKAFTFTVVTLGVLPKSIDMSRYDDATNR